MLPAILLTILGGLGLSVQVPTNAALSRRVGPLQTTLTCFVLDMVVLAVVVLLTGGWPALSRLGTVPAWELLGGLAGVSSVCLTVVATPVLGVALELTMFMLGQLLMGMVVDQLGLLGTSSIAVGPLRIAGCAVVVVGIALVYVGRRDAGAVDGESGRLGRYAGVAFAAGVLSSIQSPINATLAVTVGVFGASLVNFVVGSAALLVVVLVTQRGRLRPVRGTAPWKMIGGLYGIAYTVANVVATPVIGVGMMMSCGMLGQLAGGMAVDSLGLLEAPRVRVDGWRIAGVAVVAAGILLIAAAKALSAA